MTQRRAIGHPSELLVASSGGKVVNGPQAPAVRHGVPLAGITLEQADAGDVAQARITQRDVDRIVAIDNDLVRTRAVAVAYHLLGRQLAGDTGVGGHRNWWDFATWATVTIAWSIDPQHGWQPLGGEERQASRLRRLIAQHKATISNQFLAQANRYVFAEMASLGVTLVEHAEQLRTGAHADLDTLLEDVNPTLRIRVFGEGKQELLHHGVTALFMAAHTLDDQERARLMLVSNLAFFEYEQRRLQAYLEVLLSGRPLKRWIATRDLVSYGTGNRFSTWSARTRGRLATRAMVMQLPGRAERMSDRSKVARTVPEGLSPADEAYLSRWTVAEERTARRRQRRRYAPVDADWSQLQWRMSRIAGLFEEYLSDDALTACPYSAAETGTILRGLDPRNEHDVTVDLVKGAAHTWDHSSLDGLRAREQAPVDPPPGVTPNRTPHPELSELPWPEAIDVWVRRHNHLQLHEMLRVVHCVDDIPVETIDDIIRSQVMSGPAESVEWLTTDETADAFRLAREFFRSNLPAIGAGLVFGSLPADMAAADAAPILHQTGYFLNNAPARIARTTRFVLDVMNTGAGVFEFQDLDPVLCQQEEETPLFEHGPTLAQIRRTRVTHHVVRCWIRAQSSGGPLDVWSKAWTDDDAPVNVEDQIGTILSFSTGLWTALRNLGVDDDQLRRYEEPWYRAWCVVGVNLGIPCDELPRSAAEARELMRLLASRHLRPSQAGFELGQTLIREVREVMPSPFNRLVRPVAKRFASSAIRAVTAIPEEEQAEYPWSIAEMLALPRSYILPPRLAGAVLRWSAGQGSLAVPKGYLTRRIIAQYATPARSYHPGNTRRHEQDPSRKAYDCGHCVAKTESTVRINA